jgi:DNA-binding NtrC family response regulator
MEALAIAKRSHPDIPFIFVSGTIGEENAVRALQSGAVDYVLKGNLLRLPPAIERAMREIRERRARQVLGHCKKLFPAKGFWSIPQDPRAQRGPASCRQAAARQQIG